MISASNRAFRRREADRARREEHPRCFSTPSQSLRLPRCRHDYPTVHAAARYALLFVFISLCARLFAVWLLIALPGRCAFQSIAATARHRRLYSTNPEIPSDTVQEEPSLSGEEAAAAEAAAQAAKARYDAYLSSIGRQQEKVKCAL